MTRKEQIIAMRLIIVGIHMLLEVLIGIKPDVDAVYRWSKRSDEFFKVLERDNET